MRTHLKHRHKNVTIVTQNMLIHHKHPKPFAPKTIGTHNMLIDKKHPDMHVTNGTQIDMSGQCMQGKGGDEEVPEQGRF